MKAFLVKIKNFLAYNWLLLLLMTLFSLIICSLVFIWTEPAIPPEECLRIQMAGGGEVDFISLMDDMEPTWEETFDLTEVTVDYDTVDEYNPYDESWEFFTMDVMLGNGDVMLLPYSKAQDLADMGVLMPLDGYVEDGTFDREKTYAFTNEQGESALYAVKAENLQSFHEEYGVRTGVEDISQWVYCIPSYSKNVPAALAWINTPK